MKFDFHQLLLLYYAQTRWRRFLLYAVFLLHSNTSNDFFVFKISSSSLAQLLINIKLRVMADTILTFSIVVVSTNYLPTCSINLDNHLKMLTTR